MPASMNESNSSVIDKSVRSVFVGNIPYEATEEKLKEIFAEVGPVVSFKLVFDRETGKPKGRFTLAQVYPRSLAFVFLNTLCCTEPRCLLMYQFGNHFPFLSPFPVRILPLPQYVNIYSSRAVSPFFCLSAFLFSISFTFVLFILFLP